MMAETFDAKAAMAEYRLAFESGCAEFLSRYPDTELYAPVRYLMDLGGKRLRPVLVMAACESSSKPILSPTADTAFDHQPAMPDDPTPPRDNVSLLPRRQTKSERSVIFPN